MPSHPATSTRSTDAVVASTTGAHLDHGRLRARIIGAVAAMVGLPAAVAMAPFWAVAALTRRLPDALKLQPDNTLPWQQLLQYVPEVGWRTRPGLDAYSYADDLFHLTTDDEGWRGPLSLDDADLLVFGDSYAFGHGVHDHQVYTNFTGGLRTKALGSNGYSMVHANLWMERLAQRAAGKSAMWFVYAGNDLYDNLRPNYGPYRMPFVRWTAQGWTIHVDHVSELPWPISTERPSYLDELARMCTPSQDSERAFEAAGYLIDRAAQVCRTVGIDLTVVSVPRREQIDAALLPHLRDRSPAPARFDPALPELAFERCCTAAGLPFVALADHLEPADYQRNDIHWGPSGHEKVGQLIAHLHRERMASRSATATRCG